jgi:hypothetical protein
VHRWLAFPLALLLSPIAHGAIFTVGSDGNCTHSSVFLAVVAAATNGPAMDEIRIATNQTHTDVIAPVANQNLHVRGGFADCSATSSSGNTILRGTSSGANGTFSTSGTDGNFTLILEDLELREGAANGRRGGALRIGGSYTVEIRAVTISENQASRGGGVYVDGTDGGALVVTERSRIWNNDAFIGGGGIYCQDGGIILMVSGSIHENSAGDEGADPLESGNGGGVALNQCTMIMEAIDGTFEGVKFNTAARDGGGFYLRNDSTLTLNGNADAPVEVQSNTAANAGGGIAVNDSLPLSGNLSTAFVYNSWIDRNRANLGAGIALLTGGDVLMQRTLSGNACHSEIFCSSLSFNDKNPADASCFGAAVFAAEGSRMRVRNTLVEENCQSDAGWAFRQRLDSRLEIDSSAIARNGGSQPFFIDGTGVTSGGVGGFSGLQQVAWSTITGHNEGVTSSLFTLPNSPASAGTLRVYGSLLGEPFLAFTSVAGLGSPPPMTLEFDCLLVDPAFSGSTASSRSVEAASPYGIIAAASSNYRPTGTGAAMIDLCDESLGARANGDLSGQTNIADTITVNLYGPRDIGAYELQASGGGTIFADGFETP